MQDVQLAEHAEQYIQQQQSERAQGGGDSISHQEYDVSESRQRAFQ